MKTIAKVSGLLAGAASLTLLLPAAEAAAQQPGAYVGHTADGNLISFDVGMDAQGQPVLTDLSIKFTAGCSQSGSSVTQQWQFFFGTGLPIVHGRVKHVENTPQLYLLDSISFHNGRATGSTEARLPALADAKSQSAQLCVSNKQAFEANFQTADSAHLFDHPGNARLKAPQRTSILEWSSQGVTYQQLTRQQ